MRRSGGEGSQFELSTGGNWRGRERGGGKEGGRERENEKKLKSKGIVRDFQQHHLLRLPVLACSSFWLYSTCVDADSSSLLRLDF
jgi:hypothetical protein